MLDDGDTLMVLPDGSPEYRTEFGGRGSSMGPARVEPPADCPA